MPAQFFDLPREIRDIIYSYVLVSPTGFVRAAVTSQPKKSTYYLGPQFTLFITPPSIWSGTGTPPSGDSLSLSLPRTCQQIHEETKGLFWTRNIFSCSNPHSLISTLKGISQTPSRLITSISLSLCLPTVPNLLPRALRLLASRARHGAFRRLTLTVSRKDLIAIERFRTSPVPKQLHMYDDLLKVLREGGQDVLFVKEMKIHTLLREWKVGGGLDHDTARDLHLAWGGKMIVNGDLEWFDYVHVGRCAGVI